MAAFEFWLWVAFAFAAFAAVLMLVLGVMGFWIFVNWVEERYTERRAKDG